MVFMPTTHVKPGMALARDLRMFDSAYGHSVLLRRGQILNIATINRLATLGFSGIYIDDGIDDDISVETGIKEEIRVEFITGIKALFLSYQGDFDGHVVKNIQSLNTTISKIIEDIKGNDDFMINIIDLKMYDDYTYHHSLSVAVIALTVGMELGYNDVELKLLGLSAVLHDIGKLMVPTSIIQKPGRLTDEEFEIMKNHPNYASMIVPHRSDIPEAVFDAILSHHERLDGSGYPYGLKKDQIPMNGRILAVADVYDALTSNRPYRKPSLPSEASEYIMGGVGYYFDEQVVAAFVRKVAPYPVGTSVCLSNDMQGVVIRNNENNPLRPVIRLAGCHDTIDLSRREYLNVVIAGLGYDM